MSSWDFSGPRLKVKRAKHHIEELESRLSEWFNSDSFRLSIDNNPDTGNQCFKLAVGESMPEEIPVIIGDAIHNLRSALDFIAIEIVSKAGLSLDHVYFPVYEDRANLIDALSKSKIKRVCPQASDLILDRIQPYKAANPFIWSLNKLSNTDKHRLLMPTINTADFSNVPIEYENREGTFPSSVFVEFREDISVDIVGDGIAKMKIKNHSNPSISIFFDETKIPGILKYQVVYMLKVFSQLIESYIPMFEAI